MDEDVAEELISKLSKRKYKGGFDILLKNPDLLDLARRPVLATMIADAAQKYLNWKGLIYLQGKI
ncbi:MAG: hypothetical protein IPN46_10120 [Saprospiraceae bacterium]|nr:hypothetical protein [Saprospiraceae bacterium]